MSPRSSRRTRCARAATCLFPSARSAVRSASARPLSCGATSCLRHALPRAERCEREPERRGRERVRRSGRMARRARSARRAPSTTPRSSFACRTRRRASVRSARPSRLGVGAVRRVVVASSGSNGFVTGAPSWWCSASRGCCSCSSPAGRASPACSRQRQVSLRRSCSAAATARCEPAWTGKGSPIGSRRWSPRRRRD